MSFEHLSTNQPGLFAEPENPGGSPAPPVKSARSANRAAWRQQDLSRTATYLMVRMAWTAASWNCPTSPCRRTSSIATRRRSCSATTGCRVSQRFQNSHVACLDFSVAKGGFLTAYRWSGEPELLAENLVRVRA